MSVETTHHDSPALALAALLPSPNVRAIELKAKLRQIRDAHDIRTFQGCPISDAGPVQDKLFEVFRSLGGVFRCGAILCTQEAETGAFCIFVDHDVTDTALAKLVEDARTCTENGVPATPFVHRFPPHDATPLPGSKRARRPMKFPHGKIFPSRKLCKMQHGTLVGLRFALA